MNRLPPLAVYWTPSPARAAPGGIPGARTPDPVLGPAFVAGDDPWEALRHASRSAPGRDLLLLRADLELPPGIVPRLLGAWEASPGIEVLSCSEQRLLPSFPGLDAVAMDAACWRQGEHAVLDAALAHAHASLWRGESLATRDPGPELLATLSTGLLPCAWTSNELELAGGAGRVGDWLLPAMPAPAAAAVNPDDRPVLLHVLHAWGGGIECFARDLQAGDAARRHLFLVSRHDDHEPPFGRRMALHDDLDAAPLRLWELSRPIDDSAVHSPEVQRLLRGLVSEWGVGAVLVSSLVGHALDVLATGLPTAVCAHDAYPLWPLLHDARDPRREPFDAGALQAGLGDERNRPLFPHRDSQHWQRLRDAYVQALVANRVAMAAPSRFARERICAIEPRLAALDWQCIPHGAPALPRIDPGREARDPSAPLRVLVPGHIPGGKGEWLLKELLPALDSRFEVLLLGGGPAARPFLGQPGLRLVDHYRREELPALVADFRPDLALLPSTVPETWGYVLTEMLQLGVPVLAARIGAYAERLTDGVGGWLLAPEADAFHGALLALEADRGRLQRLPRLAAGEFADPSAMALAWQARLPARPFAPRLPTASPERLQAMREARRPQGDRERQEHAGLLARIEALQARLADEGEQRSLLEIDLGIQRDRVELAESIQQQLALEVDALQRESVGQLQAQSLLEERLSRALERNAALARAAAQAEESLSRAGQQLGASEERGRALREELAAASTRIGTLQRQVEDLQRHREEDAATKHRLEARLASLDDALVQAAGQQSALSATIASLEAELAERRRSQSAMQAENASLAHDRERLLARLDEIYLSRSWRLTAAPRAAKTWWLQQRAKLAYRTGRLREWMRRATGSLRRRGLAGSWRRLRERQAPGMAGTELALPTPASPRAPLRFAPAERPRASIVVPVYGQIPITLDCLASIAGQGAAMPFEVIVVDDCSPDPAAAGLAGIPGLRLHRNEANLGFIGACNAGAALARGEYLVFLNNDTLVQPGWLDALLATFDEHPDTGLAGSKLVYPDGRLQEAGGIVFADASGWNYGRHGDPAHPDFNFVREADYCSGAAIAIRRDLFHQLGGFDRHYAPAYYEDTDLAMRVRQHGLKVRYQPASVVVHLEGVTSGTDLSQGVKAHQVVNQGKFLERWRGVLAQSHPAPGGDIVLARSHRARRRVLVVDACTPTPDRDSGSVRMFEILRLLAQEGHAVSFFADNRMHDGPYTQSLQQLGVQAWWHPWISDVPEWLREHGPRFDAIVVSRHYVLSPLLPLLRRFAPRAKVVFDTVDLHFLREEREAEQRDDDASRRAAARTREAELSLVAAVDETWVVSPVERELLSRLAPGRKVEILSNIHRLRGLGPGHGERADLMFVGGYRHTPNVDAAAWLANEIFPLIRLRRPDIRLHLVGADTPEEVRRLGEKPGVVVHGHVPDLVPMMDAVRLNLAPLRYGAGVKGKINHSLAHGLPVVATGCAAEGMNLVHRIDAMVADGAVDFARAVLEAYEDAALWQRLAEAGLENTRRHFSPEQALPVLRQLLS